MFFEHERVGEWVGEQLGFESGFDSAKAIGIERDGNLIGGAVYNYWFPGVDIRMHIAGAHGEPWLSRSILNALFYYPFVELGLRRITYPIAASNAASLKLARHFGTVHEGTIRHGWLNGDDLLVFGMLREECRWLKDKI